MLRAMDAVVEVIRCRRLQPRSELPPLKVLAAEAGVSLVTMWKAMHELKKQGRVTVVAGHPFQVGVSVPENSEAGGAVDASVNPQLTTQTTAWKRTQQRLTREILGNAFPPGTDLPSVKELQSRCGVAYRTLAKALGAMVSDGVLERRKRGFAVPAFAARGWRPRIICLAFSFDSFTMYLAQHDEDLYKSLERECANARIILDIFLMFPESLSADREEHHLFRERRSGRVYELHELGRLSDESILGFMLVIPTQPRELEGRLLRTIAPLKRPMAILDEGGWWPLPADLARLPYVRRFTLTESPQPACAVARYLLGLGHRRIAFLSPYHAYPWSQRRLEGLCSVYSAAGHERGVVPFTVMQEKATEYDMSPLRKSYGSWRRKISPAARVDFDAEMARFVQPTAAKAAVRESLYPMFERALGDRGITAWVVVNDQTGMVALEFLASKKVTVPGDLSVVSFDDSDNALRVNLTSYNFNAAGVATAMLGYVLNRKPYSDAVASGVREIAGYIAERQTVAQAKGG